MRPEERDAIRAIGAGECLLQTFFVIDVGSDDFSSEIFQSLCFVAVGVARDCTSRESAAWVTLNRAHQPAALRAGCAHNCNDFLIADCRHGFLQVNRYELLLSANFFTHDRRCFGEVGKFHLRDHPCQRFHAAVCAGIDAIGRNSTSGPARIRSAIVFGFSIMHVRMSSTPT